MDELTPVRGSGREVLPREYGTGREDAGLKTLLSRLGDDVTQLAHDELELAKLELRDVAGSLRDDVKEAGRTLVMDLVKVGVALSLALLAGLALTAGAIIGIGILLGGAFWAGGLIVGAVLLIAAAIALNSAKSATQESGGLRLKGTKQALREDTAVLRDEASETKDFAKREAEEFKRHATQHDDHKHLQH